MAADQLTVVIPTRGRWETLGRTLTALREQSVGDFDVVVVVNGLAGGVPDTIRYAPGVRIVAKEDEGPGPARNLGVRISAGELILFLGDDTIPRPDLVARHLARHATEPSPEVAVLGRVVWHPDVASGRVNRWLEWSGAQFDYAQLDRETTGDAGFGRFYTSNVSLKRALFETAGGFDEEFPFGYEDIDFGWRAAQSGMVLRYERDAVVEHLHEQTLTDVKARFELVGAAEKLMAAKHDWFSPWFRERFARHAAAAPVLPLWALLVDHVPPSIERLHGPIAARADRWYHQQLAPGFLDGWNRQLDLEELKAYLGARFDLEVLRGHSGALDAEAAAAGDEAAFYRSSEVYLYDLTVFAMSGTKEPYRRELRGLVEPGARLLDYGCGIGSDGLRLLEDGYRVEFADFDNPSAAYLRWRLQRRGLSDRTTVHDIDSRVPGGFDLAYAFDVIEHVEDPFAFLRELEARAAIVMVNLLEPVPGETVLHKPLPIKAIVRHARGSGRRVLVNRLYHGRSHLLAYRA